MKRLIFPQVLGRSVSAADLAAAGSEQDAILVKKASENKDV